MGKMFQNLKINTKVMQARKAVGEIQAMAILAKNLHEEEIKLLKKFLMSRIKTILREAFRISKRSSVYNERCYCRG